MENFSHINTALVICLIRIVIQDLYTECDLDRQEAHKELELTRTWRQSLDHEDETDG